MNSLFIYNAEAETDVLLESFPATLLFTERMKEPLAGQLFNDLLHATFQLRSDLVPSNTEEYEQTIDDCVAPAHKITYALAHIEELEQPVADRIFFSKNGFEVLHALYKSETDESGRNQLADEGTVVIVTLGVFRAEPGEEPETEDVYYRFITVDTATYEPDNYKKYREIGYDCAQRGMDTMETLLNAGKLDQ